MNRFYTFLIASLIIWAINNQIKAQCPTGLAPGSNNAVINGDFSAGNVDFTSGYDYCNTPGCMGTAGDERTYTVDSDPALYNGAFSGADHTSGTGNFLIVNGATTANTPVWCQTISIDPNSFYIVSFWVTSLVAQNPASIQFYANGFALFSPASAGSPNTWAQSSNLWAPGLVSSVEVCLYNTNTAANGNDFGLDDISIKKCECALVVSAGPDKDICVGDSIELEGSGSASYFWSPTNSLACYTCSNPVASPATTTTYTVIVNGPGGCVALDSAVVTVFQHFDLNAGPDTTICEGGSVQLHAEGALNYSWEPAGELSDPNSANPTTSPLQNTKYYVNAVDSNGCNQSDSTSVSVFPASPAINVTPEDTTICFGANVQLRIEGEGEYTWSPSQDLTCPTCIIVTAAPPSTVTYTVTAVDSNGCSAGSDTARVMVDLDCSHLVIPSAFSPNNDGKNDFFHVLQRGIISFELRLYDRWGQLLFSTANPDATWDGTFDGKEQPVGVYIWVMKATLDDGTVMDRNGNVTLVR